MVVFAVGDRTSLGLDAAMEQQDAGPQAFMVLRNSNVLSRFEGCTLLGTSRYAFCPAWYANTPNTDTVYTAAGLPPPPPSPSGSPAAGPAADPSSSSPAAAGPSGSSPAADPSAATTSSSNKRQPADIGSGLADKRAFQFYPATQMGMGLDPGAIQAVSAASRVWRADGCLQGFYRSKLTRSQVQHDSGLIQARLNSQLWDANIKLQLQHLAAASPAGTSLVAIQRHVDLTLATWDAAWEEYLHPNWTNQKLRLHGGQERTLKRLFRKAGVQGGRWEDRFLEPARSQRFEALERGLMWCPWVNQATSKHLDRKVSMDCNATVNLQRAAEAPWRPAELCWWPDRAAAPAQGKEYPAVRFKKLQDRALKAQGPGPAAVAQ
ncbi:hypothetical protein QJQ45_014807 [Haematococcus lacustris]|nr:hypothetical protein QJQ45_014807 [Haematococcus lacustris]